MTRFKIGDIVEVKEIKYIGYLVVMHSFYKNQELYVLQNDHTDLFEEDLGDNMLLITNIFSNE